MKKQWRKPVTWAVAAAIVLTGMPVQVSAETVHVSGNDTQYEIRSLKGGEGGGYVTSPNSMNVPSVSEDVVTGLKGASNVPAAYMNTLAQLIEKYPATRNQGYFNTCWAFSAIGLAEFDLITDDKLYDSGIDLSELQLAYFTYHNEEDAFGGTYGDVFSAVGNHYLQVGGNLETCSRTLLQWQGVIPESAMPYTNASEGYSMGSEYAFDKDMAHLQNVYTINIHKDANSVKKEIMNHGSAGIGLYVDDTPIYDGTASYNGELVVTYYCPQKEAANHAVNIVGWDDNFPASNFMNTPPGNGAWLVRNSWSDSAQNSIESYFWLSYYDQTLEDAAWIMDFESADNYDYIYQYDGGAFVYKPYTQYQKCANVFQVKGSANEFLQAVSITLMDDVNVPYTVKVYTNLADSGKPTSGILAAKVSGKTSYAGTYTIPLGKSVSLPKGSFYSVVVELDKQDSGISMEASGSDQYVSCKISMECNQSFVYRNGEWADLTDVVPMDHFGNLCIKGYTQKESSSIAKAETPKASGITKNSVKLSWSKVSGAQGYEVYRSTSKYGTYKKVATVSGKTYKNTGLTKGKTYYYKVRAYKKSDGKTIVGKLSSPVKVTTKK